MTKQFIRGLKGVFIGQFIVRDKGKVIKVTGHAPINSGLSKREVINNAKLNVLYKYSYERGGQLKYDVVIELFNFNINYLGTKGRNPLITVKRKARRLKARRINVNGKYKIQIYDKDDNFIISTTKWTRGEVKRINTKKSKSYVTEVRDTKTDQVITKRKYKRFEISD